MMQDLVRRRPVLRAVCEHPPDQVDGLLSFAIAVADAQPAQVGLVLFDVELADLHPALVVVERVAAVG